MLIMSQDRIYTMEVGLLLFLLACTPGIFTANTLKFEFKHHNNEELVSILENVNLNCQKITKVYNLSETSVRFNPLTVIEFSSNPGIHKPLIPEVKLIANMHGDEVLGREVILKLANYLCGEYLAGNKEIVNLIKKTRMHFIPTINPDGWENSNGQANTGGRENDNGVDLNRNFPDLNVIMYQNENEKNAINNHLPYIDLMTDEIQPETKAVIDLITEVPFVLSANFHGGSLVANYPYDESRSGDNEMTKCPDDETVRYLASVYANNHADMANKTAACTGEIFPGGITNGAEWYSVSGGMQDFNYLATNDFEITVELGCDKYPEANKLEEEWNRNKKALLNFIWQAQIGIKGLVTDANTGSPLENAVIQVRNITARRNDLILHDITSGSDGDFYRLLTNGKYNITATSTGYKPQNRIVCVRNIPHSGAQITNFKLSPY